MEDKRGEEHIKLSTEYGGKTQLNLGHNVDGAKAKRGEGFELRTDEWGVLRAGKGIFISADVAGVDTEMLDMQAAIAQLENALSLAKSLSKAVETATAEKAETASQTTLNKSLEQLTAAGIVMHAPVGVGIVSPKAVRLASGEESVGVMSGGNTDISAGKSFTAAAGETVSLYANSKGMKLIAGKGKVDIQAQDDELSALAKKDITVISTEGNVMLNASKELVLTCGGAYIKLSGGNIEFGAPGNILLKAVNVQKMAASNLDAPPPDFPKGYGEGYTTRSETGELMPFTTYRITTGEGEVFEGVSGPDSKTASIYTSMPSSLKIEFPRNKSDSKEAE